jgi:hypothetical protein
MKTYLIIPLERNGAKRSFLATKAELSHIAAPHAQFPIDGTIDSRALRSWIYFGKKLLRQLGRLK